MTPIAQWLKASRLSQKHPDTGRPWPQEYFLSRMKAETGWTLTKAPYIALERGESEPRPETYAKLVAFWARYGIAEPDLTPHEPPLSFEERQLRLLEQQVKAAERQAAAAEAQAASTVQLVTLVSAWMPEQARDEVLARMGKDWARQVMEPTRPASDPAPARVR